MAENILDTMLYSLYVTEDNTVGLTIFEDREAATICLEKELAENLAKDIIRYARLLKDS